MTEFDDLLTRYQELAGKVRTDSDEIRKATGNWLQERTRTMVGGVIVVTFAVCAFLVTIVTLGVATGGMPKPPDTTDLETFRQIVDERMRPLEFLGNFLSGFVLPVVTLVIGFYFGRSGQGADDENEPV